MTKTIFFCGLLFVSIKIFPSTPQEKSYNEQWQKYGSSIVGKILAAINPEIAIENARVKRKIDTRK